MMASSASPSTFRQAEIAQLMRILAVGESAQLIGIGSVGKSNLVRLLLSRDVTGAYLRGSENYLFVLVDGNKMVEFTMWGLMELMLHQTLLQLRKADDEALLAELKPLYEQAIDPRSRELVFRYVDRAVVEICQKAARPLIFIFDEFDAATRLLPPRAFAFLRALRDDNKYRLMYVLSMRSELYRQQAATIVEPLDDLVSANTIWIGPHTADDARAVLSRLMHRFSQQVDEALQEQLLHLSGGHPGLLRALFFEVARSGNDLAQAQHSATVRAENRRIWECFGSEEQEVMTRLSFNLAIPERIKVTARQLEQKGILVRDSTGAWAVFSPILSRYVEDTQPRPGERVFVDLDRHTVFVDSQETEALSPLEYRLIEYLYQNMDKVCTREELLSHVYRDEMGPAGDGDVSDGRLDAIVKRLRQRLEPTPSAPQFVVTVRGHGFQLLSSGR